MIRSWTHVWVSRPKAGRTLPCGVASCHLRFEQRYRAIWLTVPALVGPIPAGINAFDFTASAPAHHLLPSTEPDEILGVTVIIITASYRDKEFVRVGYYLNTYYEEEEYKENPPAVVDWGKLWRNVLIEKPKVTR